MTWVDGVVLAVLAVSAFIAYFRGFVREVLGIGAWAGAIIVALAAQHHIKPFLVPMITQSWMLDIVALGIGFLVALLIFKIVIAWFASLVRHSILGGVDRALGIVFGLARGAFLVVLAYIVGGLFLPSTERWPDAVRDARSLPVVAEVAQALVLQLSPEYRPRLPDLPTRAMPTMDELLRPQARGRT
jgi:membrane protein required for colicin V production